MRNLLNRAYKYIHQHPRQVAINGIDEMVEIVIGKIMPDEPDRLKRLARVNRQLLSNSNMYPTELDAIKYNARNELRRGIRRWIEVGERRGEYEKHRRNR